MLGHKMWQIFIRRFDTYATVRRSPSEYERFGIFDESRLVGGVTAEDFASVERAVHEIEPELIINCIGIVKQDASARDPIASITVNSLFPHRLARLSEQVSARMIHLSTDCVFSGRKGNYAEADSPDAEDLYGRSKLLGEVFGSGQLTIRTSMIGRELTGAHGLLEWFLSQSGRDVIGFKRAVFSGLTTSALAVVIGEIIEHHSELNGLWHLAADPISKFDLLTLVKQTYGLVTKVTPDENFVCDRSLNGARFCEATGLQPPSWPEMIAQMHADPTPYEEIRKAR
jgi:dTDP-4-dehydrorhamnose reductase